MYPQAETAEGRLDSLDPDSFKYEITSKEITEESVVGRLHGRPVAKAIRRATQTMDVESHHG